MADGQIFQEDLLDKTKKNTGSKEQASKLNSSGILEEKIKAQGLCNELNMGRDSAMESKQWARGLEKKNKLCYSNQVIYR